MKSPGKLGFFFMFLSLAPLVSFAEPNLTPSVQVHTPDKDSTWERLKEEDRVTIFLRERQEGTIKEGIGKGVVDAPPCRVFQVLSDSERLVEFIPYLKARIIKSAGTNGEYVCQYLDFPWPVWDRFVNFRINHIVNYRNSLCEYFVHWRKDETYACTIAEVKKAYQGAVSNPVVPPANDGYWHLLPQEGGQKTLAYYYVFTDPGGSIPGWLKNSFVDDAILKLFRAIRERAGKSHLYPPCQCR